MAGPDQDSQHCMLPQVSYFCEPCAVRVAVSCVVLVVEVVLMCVPCQRFKLVATLSGHCNPMGCWSALNLWQCLATNAARTSHR
jgi:hypothetical protein